jgi:dTDP-4-dehydrorhamnose 3,5-epimerase-like enzyme
MIEPVQKWCLIDIETHTDGRGNLSVFQTQDDFKINRIYYLHGCTSQHDRGLHAHKELQQILIAMAGSCTLKLDDGHQRGEFVLNDPAKGLRVQNMVWREITNISDDCVLMVIADQKYSEADYIRNYQEFLSQARK